MYAVYDDVICNLADLMDPRLLHVQRLLLDPHLHYLALLQLGLVADKLHGHCRGKSSVLPLTAAAGGSSSSSSGSGASGAKPLMVPAVPHPAVLAGSSGAWL